MAVPIIKKTQAAQGNKTSGGWSASTSMRSLISHRSALKVTAVLMLIFGLLGTLSPPALYKEMLGASATAVTSQEAHFFMFLFSIREIIMAAWLIMAALYSSSETCKFLLYSILAVLMPAESYLWVTSRSFVAAEVIQKSLINQAVFVLYLVVSAYFGS